MAMQYAEEIGAMYLETSAKDDVNVQGEDHDYNEFHSTQITVAFFDHL